MILTFSWRLLPAMLSLVLASVAAGASVFGDLRGVVTDSQGRPVAGSQITLRSRTSAFTRSTQTNSAGEFFIRAVPIGEYLVEVRSAGFAPMERSVTIVTDSVPLLRFQLTIAPLSQTVNIYAPQDDATSTTATPLTLVSRDQIDQAPGGDRSNSVAMITNYVPGAVVTHDQIHIRGGHQISWLFDGVPVPNTNIADTVGPQFDPKDIDYLEVQRGGYSAENGDRTYAVLNVVSRSGFERDREAQIMLSYGNFHQTNNQFSFAGHSPRLAYYVSVNGSRSDYGLETPTTEVLHDQSNSFGGFTSLIYNASPVDQLRLAFAARRDF